MAWLVIPVVVVQRSHLSLGQTCSYSVEARNRRVYNRSSERAIEDHAGPETASISYKRIRVTRN